MNPQCAHLSGQEPRLPDRAAEREALIAATELVHAFAIVTRNATNFARTGVTVVNPWRVG